MSKVIRHIQTAGSRDELLRVFSEKVLSDREIEFITLYGETVYTHPFTFKEINKNKPPEPTGLFRTYLSGWIQGVNSKIKKFP